LTVHLADRTWPALQASIHRLRGQGEGAEASGVACRRVRGAAWREAVGVQLREQPRAHPAAPDRALGGTLGCQQAGAFHPLLAQFRIETSFGLVLLRRSASSRSRRFNMELVSCQATTKCGAPGYSPPKESWAARALRSLGSATVDTKDVDTRDCNLTGCCATRRVAARLDPSDGHPLREHGQAGCAGGDTTAARSRARGSRALASFTLRVNDERA
jgi:hypothetical protein